MTETPESEQKQPEPETRPEYKKLATKYEYLRAAGDIIDPMIAEMGGEIERLNAAIEELRVGQPVVEQAAPEAAAFPRLAACVYADIMRNLTDKIRTDYTHAGTIREIDAPLAADAVRNELHKCMASISRGNGHARQFERLSECLVAVLRRTETAIEAGERDMVAVAAMLMG